MCGKVTRLYTHIRPLSLDSFPTQLIWGLGELPARHSRFSLVLYFIYSLVYMFPSDSGGKEFSWNEGGPGSISGLGRSSGEGNGNALQPSCLENPRDRGAWRAIQSMGLQRVRHDWATSFYFFLSPLIAIFDPRVMLKRLRWTAELSTDPGGPLETSSGLQSLRENRKLLGPDK